MKELLTGTHCKKRECKRSSGFESDTIMGAQTMSQKSKLAREKLDIIETANDLAMVSDDTKQTIWI